MNGVNVGSVFFDMKYNQGAFNKSINKGAGKLQSTFGAAFTKIGAMAATAFSVVAIGKFIKSSLDLGSAITEVQNVVDVTFGEGAGTINQFAISSMKAFGLSELSAKQYTGTMGAMLKSMGLTSAAALDMSVDMAKLAGDIASFYDIDTDEAFTKIRAGISGETVPLKQIGINMSVANLEAYALAEGITKSYDAMSQAEQGLLRYNYLMHATADAQGDFTRTAGTWANQVRVLKLQWDSFKSSMGQAFIAVLTPVIQGLNTLMGYLIAAANTFKSFVYLLTGTKQQADKIGASAGSAGSALGGLGAAAENAGTAAAKGAKKAKGALASFDELNNLTQADDSGGGGGGAGAGGGGGMIEAPTISPIDTSESENALTSFFTKIMALFAPITTSLKGLGEEFKRLGGFAWQGLKDFYEGFLKPVGAWTLGTGLPRFIDAMTNGMAKTDWGKINGSLKGLWEALTPFATNVGAGLLWFWEEILLPLGTWTMNVVVPAFLDILSAAIRIFNGVLEALKPLGLWLWEEFLKPLASWTGGVIESVLKGIAARLNDVSDWAEDNEETIKNTTLTVGAFFLAWKVTQLFAFVQMSGGVVAALSLMTGGLLKNIAAKLVDKAETIALTFLYAKDFVVSVGQSIAALAQQVVQWGIATAAKIADNIVTLASTVATAAATAATWLFNAALTILTSPITLVVLALAALIAIVVLVVTNWEWIKEKALEIWTAISDFFVAVFTAIGDFFTNIWNDIKTFFINLWNGMKTSVVNIVTSIKTKLTDIITGIKTKFIDTFTSMKTAVVNVFTGIWNGIKGVINSILGGIEDMANGVVKGVNTVVRALNGLSFDIPDWVPGLGGKTFGFNVPEMGTVKLPRLAKGGLVDDPTIAMIGEAGKEAVVPLENNTGWMVNLANILADAIVSKLLMAQASNGTHNQQGDTLKLEIDGREMGEVLLDYVLAAANRRGMKLLLI